MSKTQLTYSLDQLDQAVDFLYALLPQCQVFTLVGSLGAGKTTLIRALLKKCGVQGTITSPTFTYVNVYENAQHQIFYHFDLYRVSSLDEFMQAGFDEYLYQPNSRTFIEWPELVMPLLTKKVCHITLDYLADDARVMSCVIVE